MIITDFNKMALKDLDALHRCIGIGYEINDGKIVGAVKIPTQTTKSE